MMTKAPRGTKDIVPQESYKWHYIEEKIRDLCRRYHYKEVRVPVFEHTEVFERGVGDTTDVVQKEMYTFLDKGGRSITLRPEGTSGVVRCFLENNLYADAQPTKMYYMLSCYRYEKPQAGRLREFHQFGVETFGSPNPAVDAEVISLSVALLRDLGIENATVFINSIGCPNCREFYNTKLKEFFTAQREQLCETCKQRLEKNPMRIIDCKSPVCSEIAKNAPKILHEQCPDCTSHFASVKEYLEKMDVPYQVDDSIVRGLDYYTTTVYEVKTQDDLVICGGGRYNGLVEELGGQPTPAVGFGLGLERLLLVLENQGLLPDKPADVTVYVANIGEQAEIAAHVLVDRLRKNGVSAEKDLMGRSIKAQMKYADKIDAQYVIVLGDDEIVTQRAKLKNMKTGEQTEISLEDVESIPF